MELDLSWLGEKDNLQNRVNELQLFVNCLKHGILSYPEDVSLASAIESYALNDVDGQLFRLIGFVRVSEIQKVAKEIIFIESSSEEKVPIETLETVLSEAKRELDEAKQLLEKEISVSDSFTLAGGIVLDEKRTAGKRGQTPCPDGGEVIVLTHCMITEFAIARKLIDTMFSEFSNVDELFKKEAFLGAIYTVLGVQEEYSSQQENWDFVKDSFVVRDGLREYLAVDKQNEVSFVQAVSHNVGDKAIGQRILENNQTGVGFSRG